MYKVLFIVSTVLRAFSIVKQNPPLPKKHENTLAAVNSLAWFNYIFHGYNEQKCIKHIERKNCIYLK